MNTETLFPIVVVIGIIVVGSLVKKVINLRNAGKLLQTIGKQIDTAYHSVPLWIRLTIIFGAIYIFILIYEIYHPESQGHFIPFL